MKRRMQKLLFGVIIGLLLACAMVNHSAVAKTEYDVTVGESVKIRSVTISENVKGTVFLPEKTKDVYETVLLFPSISGNFSASEDFANFAEFFALRGQLAVLFTFDILPENAEEAFDAIWDWLAKNSIAQGIDIGNLVAVVEGMSYPLVARQDIFELKAIIGLSAVVDTNPASGYTESELYFGERALKWNAQDSVAEVMSNVVLFSAYDENDTYFLKNTQLEVNRHESHVRYFRDMNRYGGTCDLFAYYDCYSDFYSFSKQSEIYYDIVSKLDNFFNELGWENVGGLIISDTSLKVKEYDKPSIETRNVVQGKPSYVRYNVKDHGVMGNGVSNDSKAIADVIQLAIVNGGGEVFFPQGTYFVDRLIHIRADKANVSIVGEGMGVTVFQQQNYDGVFYFETEGAGSYIEFSDFSIFTALTNCGTGIECNLTGGQMPNSRTLRMENVEIRGSSVEKANYHYGYRMKNHYMPYFENVLFAGPFGAGISNNKDNRTSPLYKCQIAMDVEGSVAPVFRYCYMWASNIGFHLRSVTKSFHFYNCFGVEDRIGILAEGSDENVSGVIDGGHHNSRDYAVYLKAAENVKITNMLLYNEDVGDVAEGFIDLYLSESKNILVSNTVFHYNGHSKRINILVDGCSKNISIINNIFNAKGNGVFVSDAEEVYLQDNLFTSSVTGYGWQGIIDNTEGNVVL